MQRIRLGDLFGYAAQDKIAYGHRYKLNLKRNNDLLIWTAATGETRSVIKDIGWYIEHLKPFPQNQQLVADQKSYSTLRDEFLVQRSTVIVGGNLN